MSAKFNACAICAHDIHDYRCQHPWNKPFDQWPRRLRNQLKKMVPNQWDDPPKDR